MKQTYEEALAWIHSRLPFGSRPGLERIEGLLERLDNPHEKIKTIHIAGTNGKGSTVTFLRCLLESQGLIVGTFTSPYVTRFNERISMNGPIPDEELVELVQLLQPIVAEMDEVPALAGATEFEIVTAMMYECFYQQAVDVAIVEVGLGGALDSTNVITPLVSAITTIGLDHQDILGESLAEIALQKAGIIKSDRPIVTGRIVPEALEVIAAEARRLGSPLVQLGVDYQISGQKTAGLKGGSFTFEAGELTLADLEIPLLGRHQLDNAALALAVFHQCQATFDYPIVRAEVQAALAKAQWPGRMEVIATTPLTLIDGAHNEPAMKVLVEHLLEQKDIKKITLVFAAINTKDVSQMLAQVMRLPNYELYLTTFDYPRAFALDEYPLARIGKYQFLSDWQQGITQLQQALPADEMLVITGSLYFISQVRTHFLGGLDEQKS